MELLPIIHQIVIYRIHSMQQILFRCWQYSCDQNYEFLTDVILDSSEMKEKEGKQIRNISGSEKCNEEVLSRVSGTEADKSVIFPQCSQRRYSKIETVEQTHEGLKKAVYLDIWKKSSRAEGDSKCNDPDSGAGQA